MRAIPVEDGSLHVAMPDAQTRYDMGNRRLFVTFNGRGDVTRLLLPAGVHLGGWEITLRVDDREPVFTQARAIGRLWELEGRTETARVRLVSFAAEDAAVYQQCRLDNPNARPLSARITVRLIPARPLPWSRRLQAEWTALIPRLPGLSFLWAQGWAKGLQPERAGIRPGDKTTIAFSAAERWLWSADRPPQDVRREGDTIVVTYALTVPAGATDALVWGVWPAAVGPEGLSLWPQALAAAEAYARWLQERAACRDPLLRSLVVAGLNDAISAFKTFAGDFAGFLAGPDYAYPPRLYFRDGYWTVQALLALRPDLVRQHLLSLAQGVHADGECPSGVFVPGILGRRPQRGTRPGNVLDWLPAHLDSPAFFVLLVWDYLRSTGDVGLLHERVPPHNRRLWDLAVAAIGYLRRCDGDGDGLLEKPYRPNDWADNVRRSMWVTYDQALYGAALRAGAALALRMGETARAETYQQEADKARHALNRRLWLPDRGHYANYIRPDYTEAHVSIDTLLALYFGLAEPHAIPAVLQAMRRLQTRYNPDQIYGDWGVMSVFPFYGRRRDLFGKSANPYGYHNGADWPYWDGVYGAVLLAQEDDDWAYVLTRWWSYSLEQGWLTPVEYYSPAYPVGGMLQGWSAMPAAVLLRSKEDVLPWTMPT